MLAHLTHKPQWSGYCTIPFYFTDEGTEVQSFSDFLKVTWLGSGATSVSYALKSEVTGPLRRSPLGETMPD